MTNINNDMTELDLPFEIKPAFKLQNTDRKHIESMSEDELSDQISILRKDIENAGKKCNLLVSLINYLNDEIKKYKQLLKNGEGDIYGNKQWLSVIQTHASIYEMRGYLTLLQMDAMTTIVGLYQAKNDTERIMLCKHAYTIMYEAIEDNLFKKISAGIKKYPEELKGDVYKPFWRGVKDIIKKMTNHAEAKIIRNTIDAHKCHSFLDQINAYKKCSWSQSVVNMYGLFRVINLINEYINLINNNMEVLYNRFYENMKEYIKKLDELQEQLKSLP